MKKPRRKKLSPHKQCLFLIGKLCANPKYLSEKKLYGREIKGCKDLIKKYSFEDLKNLQISESDKPFSLTAFLTKDGKKQLNILLMKKDIPTSEIKEIKELGKIAGEDIIYKKKTRTLIEFMNYEPENKRKK